MDFPAPNTAPTPSGEDFPRSPRPVREPPSLRTARAALWRRWQAFSHWMQVHTFAPAWLPAPLRHPLFGCLVGVLLLASDVWVGVLLRHALPGFVLSDLLILLTILVLALIWDVWPSFTAVLVGLLLLNYFLLPPPFAFTLTTGAQNLLLLIVGAILSLVASDRQQARQRAEQQQRQAEQDTPPSQSSPPEFAKQQAAEIKEEGAALSLAEATEIDERQTQLRAIASDLLYWKGGLNVLRQAQLPKWRGSFKWQIEAKIEALQAEYARLRTECANEGG